MHLKIHIFLFFSAVFLMFAEVGHSQDRIEGGFFLGTSYYNGDLNPGGQFYQPKLSYGGLVRVVMNNRFAFKGSLTGLSVSGSYPQKNVFYPAASGSQSATYNFERTIADMATQFELNFFEYDNPTRREETRITPYISGGLAYTMYRRYHVNGDSRSENPLFILSLPFGIGVKWKPADWVHVGLEWSFRKTFVDDLDKMGNGEIDPSDPYGFETSSALHNNDWYSLAGIFVTFDIFHRRVPCNAGF